MKDWPQKRKTDRSETIVPAVSQGLSEKQIKTIRNWIRINPEHPAAASLCENLLYEYYSPANAMVVRKWFLAHLDHPAAGDLLWKLVAWTKSRRDVRLARDWLKLRSNDQHAHAVFGAILGTGDRQSVHEAKSIIRDDIANAKYHMVDSLLHGCPDDEVFDLTRAFLRLAHKNRPGPYHWEAANSSNVDLTNDTKLGGTKRINISHPVMLMNLLYLNPSKQSSDLAFQIEEVWKNSPVEHLVLINLLRAEGNREAAIQRARLWLRQNPNHDQAEQLRLLI